MTELFCSVCQAPLGDKPRIAIDIAIWPGEKAMEAKMTHVHVRCEEHGQGTETFYDAKPDNLPDKAPFPDRDKVIAWRAEREQATQAQEPTKATAQIAA